MLYRSKGALAAALAAAAAIIAAPAWGAAAVQKGEEAAGRPASSMQAAQVTLPFQPRPGTLINFEVHRFKKDPATNAIVQLGNPPVAGGVLKFLKKNAEGYVVQLRPTSSSPNDGNPIAAAIGRAFTDEPIVYQAAADGTPQAVLNRQKVTDRLIKALEKCRKEVAVAPLSPENESARLEIDKALLSIIEETRARQPADVDRLWLADARNLFSVSGTWIEGQEQVVEGHSVDILKGHSVRTTTRTVMVKHQPENGVAVFERVAAVNQEDMKTAYTADFAKKLIHLKPEAADNARKEFGELLEKVSVEERRRIEVSLTDGLPVKVEITVHVSGFPNAKIEATNYIRR